MVEISTDRERLDVDFIHRFLTDSSYWAQGRSREGVERTIRNSLCFGAYADGRQAGFARVITDEVVFGYLADVFTTPCGRPNRRSAGCLFSCFGQKMRIRFTRSSDSRRCSAPKK